MTEPSEEMHKKVRRARRSALAELMDNVYRLMSASERGSLPTRYPEDIGEYVNALVAHALRRLSEFEIHLKKAVVGTFEESISGERFILDSIRTDFLNTFCLFVDVDGELVTVRDPELEHLTKGHGDPGTLILKTYQSYEVLTGSQAGTRFTRHQRALPTDPKFKARREPS